MSRHDSLTYQLLRLNTHDPVEPGKTVTLDVAKVMAHDGSGPVIARYLDKYGFDTLHAADRTVIVFDHYYPPKNEREASHQAVARAFCSKHQIRLHEGEGIAHQLLPELGDIQPGTVFVGADSHSCTAGAFACFGTGLGATDVAGVVLSGKLWLQVPDIVRVGLSGQLNEGISPHDLVLDILRVVTTRGAIGKVLEFVGPGIGTLDIAARMKIANHAVEMGAIAGVMGVDDKAIEWLTERGADVSRAGELTIDTNLDDCDHYIDLAAIRPATASPSKPDNVASLSDTPEVDISQVFIGSCSGGRLEDLHEVAEIVRGKRAKPGVKFLVGPASLTVLNAAMEDGTLRTLIDAGATILPPGCGACMGNIGALGPDEIEVATQNRNFTGRAGSAKSKMYLASPTTAAKVALTGKHGGQTA